MTFPVAATTSCACGKLERDAAENAVRLRELYAERETLLSKVNPRSGYETVEIMRSIARLTQQIVRLNATTEALMHAAAAGRKTCGLRPPTV